MPPHSIRPIVLISVLVLTLGACTRPAPAPTPIVSGPTARPAPATVVTATETAAAPTETTVPATATAVPRGPAAIVLTSQGEVQALPLSGEGPLTLTTIPTGTWELSLSPDGARLAFLHDGLRVRDLATGDEVAVDPIEGTLNGMSWSPDGKRLLYGVELGDTGSDLRASLRLSSLDGQQPQELGEGFAPAWSPDGARIAFVGPPFEPSPPFGGGPGGRVRLAAPDGSGARQVGGEPVYPGWQPLLWSADGARLAAGNEVIEGASGAVAFSVTPSDNTYISGIQAIAPDGSLVGFWRNLRISDEASGAGFVERDELLLVGEGGQGRSVAFSPKNECPCLPVGGQIIPAWSAGGELLVVPVPDNGLRIFGGDGLPRGAVRLPEGAVVGEKLFPEAGGRFVLATLYHNQRDEVWVIPSNGRRPQQLGLGRVLGWQQ